jgi:hypothetical protein
MGSRFIGLVRVYGQGKEAKIAATIASQGRPASAATILFAFCDKRPVLLTSLNQLNE